MGWFDIIISLLLLAAFVRGIQKGVVMQLASFAAIILGTIFAGKVAKLMLPFLISTVNISLNVAVVISYILAFTIIVFAVKFVGKLLHGILKTLQIGFLNKLFGSLVGVGTALVVLSILINLAILVDPKEEILTSNIKKESYFYSKVQKIVPTIAPYLNRELLEQHIPEKYKPLEEDETDSIYPKELHT